ncbi:hypothetical protein M0Q97_01050 [Candidatus Dojkabacteria bacterium]|jgi:hypothetical protein|nr:hypothetical protein [Candidatus Dojkabacteria bacterium]
MFSGKTNIDFRNIKNSNELEIVLNSLNDQGFGHFNDDKAHEYKIERMIRNANKLQLDSSKYTQYTKKLYDLNDYAEIENKLQSIFSNFSEMDKIKEYLDIFSIVGNTQLKIPNKNDDDYKRIIDWFNFKTKFNLKDANFLPDKNLYYYNLDKKTIKISYKPDYIQPYKFQNFYELIFNKKLSKNKNYDEILRNNIGIWLDLDEIQFKIYQNGTAEIGGNISQLKKYYYEQISKDNYYNYNIITYNNKQIINNPTN